MVRLIMCSVNPKKKAKTDQRNQFHFDSHPSYRLIGGKAP